MRVRYTETAFAELAEITSYIAADIPHAAGTFIARLERLLENLREFPRMTRFADEEGAHVVPVGRYRYLLFYAVEGEDIVVLHVRHGARRYPDRTRNS